MLLSMGSQRVRHDLVTEQQNGRSSRKPQASHIAALTGCDNKTIPESRVLVKTNKMKIMQTNERNFIRSVYSPFKQQKESNAENLKRNH